PASEDSRVRATRRSIRMRSPAHENAATGPRPDAGYRRSMTAEQIVRDFLEHLARAETDEALALLDPDVEWRNTAMPTFRGERVHQMLRDMERRGVGFEVRWGHVAATEGDPDSTVLTDRTDVITYAGWETSFGVR